MRPSTLLTTVSTLLAAGVTAQRRVSPAKEANGTVLAVFMYHNHCDRTSFFLSDGTRGEQFVSAGATMCFADGSYFFNKYFADNSPLKIYGVSQLYDSTYITVETPDNDLSVQSATAFMQGLFKPINWAVGNDENQNPFEGSPFETAPLDGYQYVPISTHGESDPGSIWTSGSLLECPAQEAASSLYFGSEHYRDLVEESKPFYERMYEEYFQGVFKESYVIYLNAWPLFDYVNQNQWNNRTLEIMPDEDFNQLKYYADSIQYNLYANDTHATDENWYLTNSLNGFREMSGRTLAGKVTRDLTSAKVSGSLHNKFNLVLGGHDPMISLFALAGLPQRSGDFYGLPQLGSSMVFELYTDDTTLAEDGGIEEASIKVAFGFRNGTTRDEDTLTYWPLFENEEVGMPYHQFIAKMLRLGVNNVGQWCSACRTTAGFCAAYTTGTNRDTDTDDNNNEDGGHNNQMHAAVAGIIGAVIMLVLLAIAGVVAFFFFGVGFKRDRRRSSVLSGIGSIRKQEKLSSEIELPLSPTAAPMPGSRGFPPRGTTGQAGAGGDPFDQYDEDDVERSYDTVSSAGTKVASPLASPKEAHFKAWDARYN